MTTGQNWFDTNESRRYPLADGADVGALPEGFLADLKLVVPAAVLATGDLPRLASASCGPNYVSVVFIVGDREVAWYGGERLTHVPLPLTPLVSGAGGFIVFGSGSAAWLGAAVVPNGILAVSAFSAVFDAGVDTLTFVSDGSATPLTDVIQIDAGANIAVAYRGDVDTYHNVIELSIAPAIDAGVNEALLGNCGKNVQAGTCAPALINAVNGVRADADGKLTIRIVNNTTNALALSGDGTGIAKLTTAMSLTRACEDKTNLITVDLSGKLVKSC